MSLDFYNPKGYALISKKLLPKYKNNLVVVITKPWGNDPITILGKQIKKGDYLIIDTKKKPKNNDFVLYQHAIRKLKLKKGIYYLKYMSLKNTPLTILTEKELKNIKGIVIKVFQTPNF